MKNSPLRTVLQEHGLSLNDLVEAGIPKGTALAHFYGARQMTLASASQYARAMKLPLPTFIELLEQASPLPESLSQD